MPNISLIKQVDLTGCGIACVSMVSGASYESVKTLLIKQEKWGPRKESFRTKAPQLLKLLKELNIMAEIKTSKSWSDISGCAIVGVNKNKNNFHWVLAVKNSSTFLILDPETAEVYQGSEWTDKKDGYFHSKHKSNYISIPKKITSIKI